MPSSKDTPTTLVTQILSHFKNATGPQERDKVRTLLRAALAEGRLDGETVALLLSSNEFLAQPRAGKVDEISRQAEGIIAKLAERDALKEPTFQELELRLATPKRKYKTVAPYTKTAKESRLVDAESSSSSSSATSSSTSSALPDGSRVLSVTRVMQRTQGMPEQRFEMPGGSSLGVMNIGLAPPTTSATGHSPHLAGAPMPQGPHATHVSAFQLQLPASSSTTHVASPQHPQAPALEQFPPPIGAYMAPLPPKLYAPLAPYAHPVTAQAVNPAPSPDFTAVPRALAAAPRTNPLPAMKVYPDGMSGYLDYGIPVTRNNQEETMSTAVSIPEDYGRCMVPPGEVSENASQPEGPMAGLRELEDVMAELDGEAMKDIALEIYRMLTEGQGAMSSAQ
ncbi:unnamed protein product [Cyclocybe aegerita]|uniref:Uncharacterized protein n=1 Tax=Cyclocybe aegerita TaxID=1973307 RepID=A0A8S0XE04_CYCAE|nr:unnamed protein product [Cyclocybe aegerita]